jgi:hypothetical protein
MVRVAGVGLSGVGWAAAAAWAAARPGWRNRRRRKAEAA